jgi:hypothetical protein
MEYVLYGNQIRKRYDNWISIYSETMTKGESNNDKKIQLLYYWPADFNKKDAILNFQNTPKMIKSFEDYIKTKYPYNKYAQVAVEDFEFGGMENIGLFEKEDSIKLLEPLIQQQHKDPSYFVEGEAATAIGKSSKHILDKAKKEKMISLLKNIVETTDTFRNVPARWAINGLKEFFKDNDKHIISEVASFLIDKSKYGNHDLVRWTVTPALVNSYAIRTITKSILMYLKG